VGKSGTCCLSLLVLPGKAFPLPFHRGGSGPQGLWEGERAALLCCLPAEGAVSGLMYLSSICVKYTVK